MELQWVELMREYHLSWQEYQDLPAYPRRVLWDAMIARRSAQRAAEGG